MNRYRFILLALLVCISVLSYAPVVLAQTATPTSTPTQTSTPTSTRTPGPTSTQCATPTPRATLVMAASIVDDGDSGGESSLASLSIQLMSIKTNINTTTQMFTETINDYALRIQRYSPMPLVRGAIILLQDFGWLTMMVGWFMAASVVIITISAIRFIVSMWGIVQRVIEVIKAIPFV